MTQPDDGRSIIRLNRMGNMANYMIQVMAALAVKSHVPAAVIVGEGLPDWNVHFLEQDVPSLPTLTVDTQKLDVERLGARLRSGEVRRLELMSYSQNMDNFLSREFYQDYFDGSNIDAVGYPATHLVINIRGGEILDAIHPFYTVLPNLFYEELIARTKLIPVFMGQIADNPYSNALREAFPSAIFQKSLGPLQDFETIRRSKNIVCAVSTFSWLAAWLSDADQIHLPLSGLLNNFQVGEINLVPLGDTRFKLHLFPINWAIEAGRLAEAHGPLAGLWRELSHEMYASLLAGKPRFVPKDDDWLAVYDDAVYLACNPDIRQSIEEGWIPSGAHHYRTSGIRENRTSFYFDGDWYSRAYPVAAFEVAQGDFSDLRHHYVSIGRMRGYLPVGP